MGGQKSVVSQFRFEFSRHAFIDGDLPAFDGQPVAATVFKLNADVQSTGKLF